jgi:hypothetical protein
MKLMHHTLYAGMVLGGGGGWGCLQVNMLLSDLVAYHPQKRLAIREIEHTETRFRITEL